MTRLLFFLFFFISSAIGGNSEYWSVSQYLNKEPNEKKVSLYFSRVVREKPIPIENQSKPVKIMMVYPGNQISDYWRRSKVSFEKRMTELQIDYTLENHFTKPGTVREQAKHLLQGVKEDVDYLI
ncbi:MAG: hypothetical protein OIF32_06260, partial [Campylobacterales bacterium]|nr:hypothetical protein [Campylobacterales bacterium]